jgi:hypothetical protein
MPFEQQYSYIQKNQDATYVPGDSGNLDKSQLRCPVVHYLIRLTEKFKEILLQCSFSLSRKNIATEQLF